MCARSPTRRPDPRDFVRRLQSQRGSVAVEYIGLGVVVSLLMASVASAVDSALGERLARALVVRLIELVSG